VKPVDGLYYTFPRYTTHSRAILHVPALYYTFLESAGLADRY
jgi:hypothetical protein